MFQSDYSIRIAAGENHGDRALAVSLGERAKEKIDCHAPSQRLLGCDQMQRAVFESELMIWWNHIDVIWLHLHRFVYLHHRHRRFLFDHAREIALVFRREMHHHDESQPAFR